MSNTIKLTPTWRALIPVLVEVAANAESLEARKAALNELYRLADLADRIIAEQNDQEVKP